VATGAPTTGWVGQEAGECPRCGAGYAPLQEYCLECGLRLPLVDNPEPRTGIARVVPTGQPWIWPVLVALVAAILAVAAVLVARLTDDSSEEALVATTTAPPFLPATEPPPVVSETVPTLPTPRTTPTVPSTSPARPQAPRRGELVEWPAGRDAWTVILASYPTSAGQPAATSRAKEASEAGLPRVGVLDSSEYASLHPGYLVVFSGSYDSQADAEAALDDAHEKGYGAAYAKEIASSR